TAARRRNRLAAAEDPAAFFAREREVAPNLRMVRLGDERALFGGRVERVADAKRLRALDQFYAEAVVDGVLHEDARAAQANFALVGERRADGRRDRLLEVCVVENEYRVLAAKLKRELLEQRGRDARDPRPGLRATGEGDGFHARMRAERLTRVRAGA